MRLDLNLSTQLMLHIGLSQLVLEQHLNRKMQAITCQGVTYMLGIALRRLELKKNLSTLCIIGNNTQSTKGTAAHYSWEVPASTS